MRRMRLVVPLSCALLFGCLGSPVAPGGDAPRLDRDEAQVKPPVLVWPADSVFDPNTPTLAEHYESRVVVLAHRVFDIAEALAARDGVYPTLEEILQVDPELRDMSNPLNHPQSSAPLVVDESPAYPGQIGYMLAMQCGIRVGCTVSGLGAEVQVLVVLSNSFQCQ